MCAASRREMPTEDMIRFVVGPADQLVPDIRKRLPGRGVWIEGTREAINLAVRRKVFGRSLKASVVVSPDLALETERLLRQDTLQALAMANKAGKVVTGFGKVEELAARNPGESGRGGFIAALIHASEAAPDGRRKLAQALHRGHGSQSDDIPVIDCFGSVHLDLALGRTHVIHAGLVAGSGSDGFMTRWHRLARYCATEFSTFPQEGSPVRANASHDARPEDASNGETVQVNE